MQSTNSNANSYLTRPARPTDLPALPAVERSAGTVFRTIEGLETLADDDPLSIDRLQEILEQTGKIWVAVRVETRGSKGTTTTSTTDQTDGGLLEKESVVGFLAAFPLSPQTPPRSPSQSRYLHIAELSIHAEHQRCGLGGRLMNELIRYAEESNSTTSLLASPSPLASTTTTTPATPQVPINALTLTTYRDISFNGPFYARFGFRATPVDEILINFGAEARRIWDEEQASIPRPEARVWMALWMTGRMKNRREWSCGHG